MHLSKIQLHKKHFDDERGWTGFSASQVYVHLIEEIGEIGRHILYVEGYKKGGLGHSEAPKGVDREFAQSLSLLIQLANMQGVELEKAYLREVRTMERRFPAREWKKYTRLLRLKMGRNARKGEEISS